MTIKIDKIKHFFSRINPIGFFVVLAIACCANTLSAKDFTVVIDAGHGGKDVGAVGSQANEKNINLAVALKLGALINAIGDDVKVVYTRDKDVFIPLNDRAKIANRAKGDLFISIHVNSVDRRSRNRNTVAGAEVYTVGLHKSDDNLAVARRENSVITLESDYTQIYSGFDPNSAESYIAFELNQSKHIDRSIEFAALAQHELVTTAGRADKGVRQAGFWVLWATSMPSVLVELDFICNPQSEKFLNSVEGQNKLATALYNAFVAYYANVTGNSAPAPQPVVATQPTSTQAPKEAAPSEIAPSEAAPSEIAPVDWKPADGESEFRVQIVASETPLSENSPELKGVTNSECYFDRGMYKYTLGHYRTSDEAKAAMREVRRTFPTAFVVELRDGKRVN